MKPLRESDRIFYQQTNIMEDQIILSRKKVEKLLKKIQKQKLYDQLDRGESAEKRTKISMLERILDGELI
jgi:hypothetical protein